MQNNPYIKSGVGIRSTSDYSGFGVQLDGRTRESDGYRYGFQGQEKDDEIKGEGNSISFNNYGYDSRIGRRLIVDPKSHIIVQHSTYSAFLNCPIIVIDPNGQFPILVNGKTFSDDLRGSAKYWDSKILKTIEKQTGYKLGKYNVGNNKQLSQFSGDFYFVDGNQGMFASDRFESGKIQGVLDADEIWKKMKETISGGKITEQLQLFSHSRGSAYAAGYMESLRDEIQKRASKEGIEFAYDKEAIFEYSINLAPHQSNFINYSNSETKNVNISHLGDFLSGNDATGDVINIHSAPDKEMGPFDQHTVSSFNRELKFVLNVLETNKDKGKLKGTLEKWYGYYDNNRTNGGKSSVN
jgi:hypothetical protein